MLDTTKEPKVNALLAKLNQALADQKIDQILTLFLKGGIHRRRSRSQTDKFLRRRENPFKVPRLVQLPRQKFYGSSRRRSRRLLYRHGLHVLEARR